MTPISPTHAGGRRRTQQGQPCVVVGSIAFTEGTPHLTILEIREQVRHLVGGA